MPLNNLMKPPSYSTGTYEPEAQLGENGTRLDIIKQYLDPTSPKMNIQTQNYNIPNPKYPMDTMETVSTMDTTLFVPNQSTVVSPSSNTIVIPNQKTVIVPPSQHTVIVPTQNTIVVPKPNPTVIPSQKTIVVPTQRSIIIPSSRTVVVPTQNNIMSPTVNTPAISNKPIQSMMNTNAYNLSNVINLPSTSTLIPSVGPTLIGMPTTLRPTSYNAYKPRPLSSINNANRFFPRKMENSYDNLNLSRNRRRASRTPIKYNISTFIPKQRRTTSQINNNLKDLNKKENII